MPCLGNYPSDLRAEGPAILGAPKYGGAKLSIVYAIMGFQFWLKPKDAHSVGGCVKVDIDVGGNKIVVPQDQHVARYRLVLKIDAIGGGKDSKSHNFCVDDGIA
jgi:hypothetical protein